MEAIYLKRNTKIGYQYFVKITLKGIIKVDDECIHRKELDGTIQNELDWFKSVYECIDATKKEYDDFYIKTANYINELNNL